LKRERKKFSEMEGKREGRAGLADVAAFVHSVYSLPSSKLIRLSEQ